MNKTPMPNEKEHIWDKPENVARLLNVFYFCCVVLVLLDLAGRLFPDFVPGREVHHPWEGFLGFHAFYGFVACWTLVVVAKAMRRVLMRGEDYYDVD